jgi:glutaminyl-peptide cyclotransferase
MRAGRGHGPATVPIQACRIVATYKHDRDAFTQGLFWSDGHLYESTGLAGRSTIRRTRLKDGRTLASAQVPDGLFGEGIAPWRDEILSVTYQGGAGFRWDKESLALAGRFRIDGEGWGLAADGDGLILSDGSATLRFLDPETMAVRRRLLVTAAGRPLNRLNALQWVNGEILANIFAWPAIARIDPASGALRGWIDLREIAAKAGRGDPEKMANGIAWDAEGQRLFVTGKNWPSVYQIEF